MSIEADCLGASLLLVARLVFETSPFVRVRGTIRRTEKRNRFTASGSPARTFFTQKLNECSWPLLMGATRVSPGCRPPAPRRGRGRPPGPGRDAHACSEVTSPRAGSGESQVAREAVVLAATDGSSAVARRLGFALGARTATVRSQAPPAASAFGLTWDSTGVLSRAPRSVRGCLAAAQAALAVPEVGGAFTDLTASHRFASARGNLSPRKPRDGRLRETEGERTIRRNDQGRATVRLAVW